MVSYLSSLKPKGNLTMKRLMLAVVAVLAGAAIWAEPSYDATLNTADTATNPLAFSDASHWTFADSSASCAPNMQAAEGKLFYAEKNIYVPSEATSYDGNVFYGTLYCQNNIGFYCPVDSYVWLKGGLHLLNGSPYLRFTGAGDHHFKGDLFMDQNPCYVTAGGSKNETEPVNVYFDDVNLKGVERLCIVTSQSDSLYTGDVYFHWDGSVSDYTGSKFLWWKSSGTGRMIVSFKRQVSLPKVTSFTMKDGVVLQTCAANSENTVKNMNLDLAAGMQTSQLDPVNGSTIIVDGDCTMVSSTTLPGTYQVPTNGTVRVKNLKIGEGATLCATYTGESPATSCGHPIEVTTALTLPTGKIGLRVDYAAGVTGGPGEVQLLKVPTSVKTLTEDMFEIVQGRVDDIPSAYALPTVTNLAIRVEDGNQIVCLYPRDLVRAVKEWNKTSCLSAPEVWSDNRKVHAGADYYSAYTLRFSGEKIIADTMNVDAMLTTGAINSDDFRMNGRQIQSHGGLTWSGAARLIPSTTGYAMNVLVYSSGYAAFPISATFSGPGDMSLVYRGHATSDCGGGRVFLTGDNSAFTGAVKAYAQGIPSDKTEDQWFNDQYEGWNVTLCIEDEKNLGGALPNFTYNALTLKDWACLEVTNNVTLSDNNRGVLIGNKARINVAEGMTLAISRPIVYSGILRKEGAGTLALGARPKFNGEAAQEQPVEGQNKLDVRTGAVKPLSTAAFTSLDLAFAADTTLAVDAAATDAALRAKGLVVTGEKAAVAWPEGADDFVNVRIDGRPVFDERGLATVGVITLPTQEAAQTALGKLRIGRVPRARAALRVADAANADGSWSVVADVRLVGAAITFR